MNELRVVLIEDNDGDALHISEILQYESPQLGNVLITRGESIGDLVRMVADGIPADIILLDLGLPDAQGIDALKSALSLGTETPIVVLTGSRDDELARQAIQTGAQDYLIKGVDVAPESVQRSIRYALDRVAQTRALRASRDELSLFAHRVAHDLKSPLASVIGFLELMNRTDEATSGSAYLEPAVRASQRLASMVDQLLAYAETAGSAGVVEPVRLDGVVEWVQTTLAEQLKEATVQVDVAEHRVYANQTAMRHSILNIVDNSTKYADPDRPLLISIVARQEQRQTVLEISDNGIGIDPEHRRNIFSEGYRVHADGEGTGLGLATVRSTVGIFGGELKATEGPNEIGTTIAMRLPTPSG